MHRLTRPEGLDLDSDKSQRSNSISSNPQSIMSAASSLASPPVVNPEPAYIAASAAAQIVTREHQTQGHEWFDERGGQSKNNTAFVSPAALNLVNAFLDQLLFNFLASARSTSLASLRPAIAEVLKPRLAREAIAAADEELHESLGGGDDEELLAFHNGQEPSNDWDLELIWKRTRLRCMVYIRLGDMEEEDEELYSGQDPNQVSIAGPHRLSRDLGAVSPAVAIFLTSILEFIGEHALMVAGEAAYNRNETNKSQSGRRGSGTPKRSPRIIVEEIDMEKVAFNTTLGRLWRTWRKRVRSPQASMSKPFPSGSLRRKGTSSLSSISGSRKNSVGATDEARCLPDQDQSAAEVLDDIEPASIPLPLTANDIDEIEVPGYSPDAFPRAQNATDEGFTNRPSSMINFAVPADSPPSHTSGLPKTLLDHTHKDVFRQRHHRSHSLPSSQTTFVLDPDHWPLGSASKTLTEALGPTMLSKKRESVQEDDSTPFAERLNESEISSTEPVATVKTGHGPSKLFHGSVLNAISQHAARELETAPEFVSQGEPNVGANVDYPPRVDSTVRFREKNGVSKTAVETRYPTSPSIYVYPSGDVSPLQPDSSFGNGAFVGGGSVEQPEVSDLSDSDEAENNRVQNVKVYDLLDSPNSDSMQGRQQRAEVPLTSFHNGEHEIASARDRDLLVVRAAPSTTHSVQTSDGLKFSSRALVLDNSISPSPPVSRALGAENGAPPLTPLREMMEAAHDTSDDGSSFAPSHDVGRPGVKRYQKSYEERPVSLSSSEYSYGRDPSSGSTITELRHQLPAVYTGLGTERAAVQRVSPVTAHEPGEFRHRPSTSSNRDQRAIHTSGSNTSQVSQKLQAHGGYGDKELLQSRTSSDSSANPFADKYNRRVVTPEEKERSFEQLIQSEETLQYTLTPQNMREMEAPDSPRWSSLKRSESTDLADSIRDGGPSTVSTQSPPRRSREASLRGLNGLRSNPVDAKPPISSSELMNKPSATRSSVNGLARSTTKRGPQPIARDARTEKDSTRDFADFIRSTGPENEPKPMPGHHKSRPLSVSRPSTASNGASHSAVTSLPVSPRKAGKVPLGSSQTAAPRKRETNVSKSPGLRLQARDAKLSRNDGSSELIDFIRQGPPLDRTDGSHRIPRTVAPFRTTMDSDEIHDLGHGKSRETLSVASTLEDSLQSKSLRSSSNSRTGLLDSTNKVNAKGNSQSSHEKKSSRFDESPLPTRKQRRVKDPYAIDSDDDGYDEYAHTPKPKREEESLMDFLRSVTPPSQGGAVPSVFANVPNPNGKGVQRKPSAPSMRARFARNGSSSGGSKNVAVGTSNEPTSLSPGNRGPPRVELPQIGQLGTRATSPQLAEPIGFQWDTYKSTSPNYATHVDRQRNGPSRSARAPRAERDTGSDSRELADFFKNSAPPPATQVHAPSVTKEDGGFKGLFSRRKKSAASG